MSRCGAPAIFAACGAPVGHQRALRREFIGCSTGRMQSQPATPARAGRRTRSRQLAGPRQNSPFEQRLAAAPAQAASRNMIVGSKLAGAP